MKKKKILMLSDHALSTSGVGVQSRYLIEGLVATGKWTVRQFGAAIKHNSYDTIAVNEDFIIKPIDGFGNPDLLRVALATEKPDVLLIFTDPRFFTWVFQMEDELKQLVPLCYNHLWDNLPVPKFNKAYYESVDLMNCISHFSYEFVKEMVPNQRVNYIPHTLPKSLYFKLSDDEIRKQKIISLGESKADHFTLLWINRNARRKRPADVLWAWKLFLDDLEKKHGHKNATLLLHTNPQDKEGPNLFAVAEMLGIVDNIVFSRERIDFQTINVLHNIADCTINISYAEGFGLGTLESMQVGTPVIAMKTGGLTRQVVDYRDGSENGVALPVEFRSLVGSQTVSYIYEDYCSVETVSKAIMKMHELNPAERKKLSQKVQDYVSEEFDYDNMISEWDRTLTELTDNWDSEKNCHKWTCEEITV